MILGPLILGGRKCLVCLRDLSMTNTQGGRPCGVPSCSSTNIWGFKMNMVFDTEQIVGSPLWMTSGGHAWLRMSLSDLKLNRSVWRLSYWPLKMGFLLIH